MSCSEIVVHDGIHFVDLQRLIFARRGKACPVIGLDSLAGRLRAGRHFSRMVRGTGRRAAPFLGRIGRIGRMVWGGCWMVSWDGGRTRVFWQWGDSEVRGQRSDNR